MTRRNPRSECGFTLVELLIAMSLGLIVATAAMAIVIGALHFSSNDQDRIDANQQGRNAMTRIVQALDSSCVSAATAPILASSTATSISFYSDLADSSSINPEPGDDLAHRRLARHVHRHMEDRDRAVDVDIQHGDELHADQARGPDGIRRHDRAALQVLRLRLRGRDVDDRLCHAAVLEQRRDHLDGHDLLPGAALRRLERRKSRRRLPELGRPAPHAGLRSVERQQPAMQPVVIGHRMRGRVRWRDERGITVLLALLVLTVTTLIVGATYIAVLGDTGLSRNDLDQQRAYAAAQAGIAAFTYQLNQNPNYWENCVASGTVSVPGSTDNGSTEYYSTRELPASTAPSTDRTCDASNPLATVIEGNTLSGGGTNFAAGTFRVSSTGTSNDVTRTIVAQYKRQSFLNFVYYTDYETLDPSVLYNPNNTPTEPTDCAAHYPNRGSDCGGPINFFPADTINGPLHSEDTLAICGTTTGTGPTFGRTGSYSDSIQAAGVNVEGQSNCFLHYTINPATNTLNTTAPSLLPPPTNAQLLQITQPAYHFTGVTHILLSGGNMTIKNAGISGGTETVAFPSNGVVYVSTATSGCSTVYTPYTADTAYTTDSTTSTATCGNVYVSGNYTSPLTIASDNDIIIDGNITTTGYPNAPTGNELLGLVANQFVRVYHPVTTTPNARTITSCNNVTNASGTIDGNSYPLNNLYVYAAILAVNHSFIVDNYDCGAALGTLHIWGAIAQLFRGTVSTGSNGTISTGYAKNYEYNDLLADLEPPYFLNPVSAAWYVQRLTECNGSSC